jgi:hypothetical protein
VFPIGVVKRYLKMEKKQTTIPCPLLIGAYNKFVGRRDLKDKEQRDAELKFVIKDGAGQFSHGFLRYQYKR